MDLNIVSLLYITFRLAPFILVCFFTLSSIFNSDFKGVIYLAGLLIASFIATMTGNSSGAFAPILAPTSVCNVLSLSNGGPISKIPLSIIVYAYTAGYIFYTMTKYGGVTNNIATFLFFPLLIIADIFWNNKYGCATPLAILVGLILGGGIGALWAFGIDSTKLTSLLYFGVGSNKQVCSMPKKQLYRCKYADGTPVKG